MKEITKLSVFLSLLLSISLGCYENEDGCLDITANNFDSEADIACEDCCNYPSLALNVTHLVDTFSYSASRKVFNGLGDSILIIKAGLLLNDFQLTQGAETASIRNSANFSVLSGGEVTTVNWIDDFVGVSTTLGSSYTVGNHAEQGTVNAISLTLGLTATQSQVQPASLAASHPLSTEAGFWTTDSGYFGGYMDILYDTMTMDTIRYMLPSDLAFTFKADTSFQIEYGSNATLRLAFDYLKWIEGINFVEMGDNEAQVIESIVNNLPNGISLLD